jgi:hypothetical protein
LSLPTCSIQVNPRGYKSEVITYCLKDTRHFYDSYIKDYEDGIAEISFVHRLRNSLAHNGNNDLRFFPIGEGNQEVSRIKSIINN